jgi:hypothetical protein
VPHIQPSGISEHCESQDSNTVSLPWVTCSGFWLFSLCTVSGRTSLCELVSLVLETLTVQEGSGVICRENSTDTLARARIWCSLPSGQQDCVIVGLVPFLGHSEF